MVKKGDMLRNSYFATAHVRAGVTYVSRLRTFSRTKLGLMESSKDVTKTRTKYIIDGVFRFKVEKIRVRGGEDGAESWMS